MAVYTYSLSGDFPNQEVSIRRLREEIIALGGAALMEHVHVDEANDTCYIVTKVTLTAPQKTALDGVIAAHTGDAYQVEIVYADIKMVDQLINITTTSGWQELGGIVVDPYKVVPASRINNVFIRLTGAIRTQGTEVQFVLAEDVGGLGTTINILRSPPFDAPDTSNAWRIGEVETNVTLTGGEKNVYTLAARLRGSTSAAIRYAQATLLERRDFR
jgi:hypothetical protein